MSLRNHLQPISTRGVSLCQQKDIACLQGMTYFLQWVQQIELVNVNLVYLH